MLLVGVELLRAYQSWMLTLVMYVLNTSNFKDISIEEQVLFLCLTYWCSQQLYVFSNLYILLSTCDLLTVPYVCVLFW